jgi:hypothetical protein
LEMCERQSNPERRQHRRLEICLPTEIRHTSRPAVGAIRTVTRNISTGGIYFESPPGDFEPGHSVDVHLSVPPGDGYSPYAGAMHGSAEIVRVDEAAMPTAGAPTVGVAARFRDPLTLTF